MRIGNSTNFSDSEAKTIREARSSARKTKSSGSSSSGSILTGNSSSSAKNTTAGAIYTAQQKKNYTAIKDAAAGLQGHAAKLLATGDNSLFKTDSESDATEQAADRKTLTSEISGFIDDYNTMISKMSQAKDTTGNIYLKSMKNYTTKSKAALKELGITQKSDGTLSLKQATLSAADTDKIKEVFGEKKSLVDKITIISESVEKNANSNLTSLSKNTSYNRNGSISSIFANSGNIYNSKG